MSGTPPRPQSPQGCLEQKHPAAQSLRPRAARPGGTALLCRCPRLPRAGQVVGHRGGLDPLVVAIPLRLWGSQSRASSGPQLHAVHGSGAGVPWGVPERCQCPAGCRCPARRPECQHPSRVPGTSARARAVAPWGPAAPPPPPPPRGLHTRPQGQEGLTGPERALHPPSTGHRVPVWGCRKPWRSLKRLRHQPGAERRAESCRSTSPQDHPVPERPRFPWPRARPEAAATSPGRGLVSSLPRAGHR